MSTFRALLIRVTEFSEDGWQEMPAGNLSMMRTALKRHCPQIARSAEALHEWSGEEQGPLAEWVATHARAVGDKGTLLVYLTGMATVDANGRLLLARRQHSPADPANAIAFEEISRALVSHAVGARLLIMDVRAAGPVSSDNFSSARDCYRMLAISDAGVWPDDAAEPTRTALTDALCHAIAAGLSADDLGDSRTPAPELLTLPQLYDAVSRRLKGAPWPHESRRDIGARVPVARNAKHQPAADQTTGGRPPRRRGAMLVGAALLTAAALVAAFTQIPTGGDAPEAQPVWQRADGPTCVGITDGVSLAFDTPSATMRGLLGGVAALNARERAAARAAGAPLATIVLVTAVTGPVTPPYPRSCPTQAGPADSSATVPSANSAVPGCPTSAAGGPPPPANDQSMVALPSDLPSAADQIRGAIAAICAYESAESGAMPDDPPQPRLSAMPKRARPQLLVANAGSEFAHARAIADAIVRAKDQSHVVAVLGLNRSMPATQDAIGVLNDAHIPMIGSTVSADEYTRGHAGGATPADKRPYPYFFRIGANNARETEVLFNLVTQRANSRPPKGSSYLAAALHRPNVCVIEEPPADRDKDTYVKDLTEDVHDRLGGKQHVIWFKPPPSGQDPNAVTETRPVDSTPCAPSPDDNKNLAFFYTGRTTNLRGVLKLLTTDGYDRAAPIVGNDDVGQLQNIGVPLGRDVYFAESGYSQPATPAVPYTDGEYAHSDYPFSPFMRVQPAVFGVAPVTGKAMAAFDAFWVTANALAQASSPDQVRDAAQRFCGAHALRGATGLTSFDRWGDRTAPLVVIHKLDGATGLASAGYNSGVSSVHVLTEDMASGDFDPAICQRPPG